MRNLDRKIMLTKAIVNSSNIGSSVGRCIADGCTCATCAHTVQIPSQPNGVKVCVEHLTSYNPSVNIVGKESKSLAVRFNVHADFSEVLRAMLIKVGGYKISDNLVISPLALNRCSINKMISAMVADGHGDAIASVQLLNKNRKVVGTYEVALADLADWLNEHK